MKLLLVFAAFIQAEIITKLRIDEQVQKRLEPPLVVFGENYVAQNPLSLVFIERYEQPGNESYAITDALTNQTVFLFQKRNNDWSKDDLLKTPEGSLIAYRNMTDDYWQYQLCHGQKISSQACSIEFQDLSVFIQVFKGDVYNTATTQNVKIIIRNHYFRDIRVYMRDPKVLGRILVAKIKNIKVRNEFNAARFASHYQISIRPGVDAAFITLLAIELSFGSMF